MKLTDKQKLILATIIVAVEQGDPLTGRGAIPSGHLYALLTGSVGLVEYQQLLAVAESSDMISRSGHTLRITPYGAEVVDRLSAVVLAENSDRTMH